jgi:rod shape-determining protein MreD
LGGAIPDLILVFVTFYAILNGSTRGFSYGFLCGLFEDLYVGRFVGMSAISKGLTALVIGKLEVNVFKDNIFVGFGGVVLASVLNSILMLLLAMVTGKSLMLDKSTLFKLGEQLIYNGLLSIPLYVWYYRSSKSGLLKVSKHKG